MNRLAMQRRIKYATIVSVGFYAVFACASKSAKAQADDGLLAARNLQKAFVSAIQGAERSVVSIARFKSPRGGGESSGMPPAGFIPNEFGSGVLITNDKAGREPLVLTNYHIVRGGPVAGQDAESGGSDILIRFHDRRRVRASIIAADPRSDLAVLRLKTDGTGFKPSSLIPFMLGSATTFRKGQFVITLANPYAQSRDGSASAGWGIISNISRRPERRLLSAEDQDPRKQEKIYHFGTLLQIDARLNLGSSGGAVLNLDGKLIGLITSLAALEGYEKSVGYAVSFDPPTRRIIDSLVQGFEVEYGFLGIGPATATARRMRNIGVSIDQPTAAIVLRVVKNSPAEAAGLHRDDIILSVNGTTVYDQYDLMREVALVGPGRVARLQIRRGRERTTRTIPVKLGKWPVVDDEGIVATKSRIPPWRGLSVDYPTARETHLEVPLVRYLRAVLVTGVDADSPAANRKTEINVGDYITLVNGVLVATPAEFAKAVSNLTGPVKLRLADGRRVMLPAR